MSIMEETAVRRDAESVAGKIVLALAFFIPVLAIPIPGMPFQFTKVAFAIAATLVLISLFAIASLKNRSLTLPRSSVVIGLVLLPVSYLISVLFSTNPMTSLVGQQLDPDTFGFVLALVALSGVVFLSLRSGRAVFSALMGLFAASVVVFAFQLVQVFLGAPLPIAAFDSPIVNLVGKWNDFALFSGLIAGMLLIALESLELSKVNKIAVQAVLAVSLVFLAIINFALAWVLVGAVAFITFVYSLVRRSFSVETLKMGEFLKQGAFPLLALLLALFFLLAGTNVATQIQQSLGTEALEVRPSVEGTRVVLEKVYISDALFGTGPNTFSETWLVNRPPEILLTPFWNVGFGAGFGTVPTAFVTGGVAVGASWLLLLLLILYAAGRAFISSSAEQGKSFFLTTVLTVGIAYLFAAHIFYVPSPSISILLFLFIGLFLVTLRGTPLVKSHEIAFASHPRTGFISVLVLVIAVAVSLASLFGVGRLYASVYNHERAIIASATGDREAMETYATRALNYSEQDRYYRTLALSEVARLNELVSGGVSDEAAQEDFRVTLANAINAGQRATDLNPERFENWFLRALTYSSVVPLGISGAYENAVLMLEEARTRNPGTPEVDTRLAELELVRGNTEQAKALLESSLEKKADYTPAILLLGQIALEEGNLDQAIRSVEAALFFDQQNPLLFYQLGVLHMAEGNYDTAITAFQGALRIDASYANAQFFLAQAFALQGRAEDALTLFRDLGTRNPDNETLTEIIRVLESGQNPFGESVALPPESETSDE